MAGLREAEEEERQMAGLVSVTGRPLSSTMLQALPFPFLDLEGLFGGSIRAGHPLQPSVTLLGVHIWSSEGGWGHPPSWPDWQTQPL